MNFKILSLKGYCLQFFLIFKDKLNIILCIISVQSQIFQLNYAEKNVAALNTLNLM